MGVLSPYRVILILLLTSATATAFAQASRIDSLKSNIAKAVDEKQQLSALLAFCSEWDSYSPDTLHKYASQAKAVADSQKNETGFPAKGSPSRKCPG